MGSQPPPGDLLDRGIEPTSTELQVDSLPYVSPGKPVSYVSCNNPFLAEDYSVGSGWAHCYLVFIVFSPFSGKSWKTHIVILLYLWAFRVFNQLQMKNIQKKIPESSKKQNLNLLHGGSYLHIIYIVSVL